VTGRVWKFGDKISTDLMVPGSYVLARRNIEPREAAQYCMRANRPDWAAQVRPGDILIAGRNFGCGSSRNGSEPLKLLGIAAVLVESVSRIHLRNAINTGLPTLVCPGILDLAEEGQRIRVDILSGKVPALYNGALVPAAEAEALGFRIQILAGAALISAYYAVCRALQAVRDTGQLPAGPLTGATPAPDAGVPDIRDLLGLPDIYERERRYQVAT
jgi:3-isopropylmalate/(R)-2-methylmalate dehydratase small subunit